MQKGRRVMTFIRKIWDWLFRPKRDVSPKARRVKRQEEGSAHYYLGDLLDNMDLLFSDFRLIRQADPDAYALAKKWGATVASSGINVGVDVDPHFLQSLPGHGCFYTGAVDRGGDRVPAKFLYFTKEKKPVNVHGSLKVMGGRGTAIYRCGAVFEFNGHSVASQFYIGVSGKEIYPLKVCQPTSFSTSPRSQPIVRMQWGYPQELVDIAADNEKSVEQMALEWFSVAANLAYTREAGMTVTATKGAESASFGIDVLRTPYFFSDRKKTVNENGKTKPIIHLVRGHYRTLAGGSRKFIKPHFRGEREFSWKGYNVRVGMAGWHGVGISDFNLAGLDVRQTNDPTCTAEELAGKIDSLLA